MAAVVESRDRLLARIAPLRERDVRLVQSRLGGENRLVELLAPRRNPRLDACALELLSAELGLGQKQEVVGGPSPDSKRRDQPSLRRQQQRVEDVLLRDVVRDHALKE